MSGPQLPEHIQCFFTAFLQDHTLFCNTYLLAMNEKIFSAINRIIGLIKYLIQTAPNRRRTFLGAVTHHTSDCNVMHAFY